MPVPPSKARNATGPWVIVLVPMIDDDQAFPSRRRFYAPDSDEASGGPGAAQLHHAHQFTDLKEARHKANRLMFVSRNVWAVVVPHAIAWALIFSKPVPWKSRAKVPS